MMTAGAGGTYYFHYIAFGRAAAGGGFLLLLTNNTTTSSYPPQYLATQVITKEWVQPVDAIHKLFKVASDVKDDAGTPWSRLMPSSGPTDNGPSCWSIGINTTSMQ